MQNNHSRVGPIHNYPDPINQVQFSTNSMIGSPKGVNSSRMFPGVVQQQKGMQSGFPSGHLPPQQQPPPPNNNVLHQINNNNNSSQQHLNLPWSNGSAGSSG